MNVTIEKLSEHIERKISKFEPMDRITIINEVREFLDRLEREAKAEELEWEEELLME
jgi:hypothetical protein